MIAKRESPTARQPAAEGMVPAKDRAQVGKSKLYKSLSRVTNLFEQGLTLFRAGKQPADAALSHLTTVAEEPIKALGGRLRQMAPLHPRIRKGAALPESSKEQACWYLGREDYFANRCLISIDRALNAAMDVMHDLLSRREWGLIEGLVRWTRAVHPQLGAVAALEASAMMRRQGMGLASEKICREFLETGGADTLSCSLRQLLSLEIRMAKDALAPPALRTTKSQIVRLEQAFSNMRHSVTCLAVDPHGRLFAGGFEDDLAGGGISFADPGTGETSLLHGDIAVSGLDYDPPSGRLFAVVLRGAECEGPHLAVFARSGRIEQVVDLCAATGKKVLPCFVKIGSQGIFFRDAAEKTLYELDPGSLRVKREYSKEIIKNSINYNLSHTPEGERLLLFGRDRSGIQVYDTGTDQISCAGPAELKNVYAIARDYETGDIYTYGVTYVFAGNPSLRSRIGELCRVDQEGIVVSRFWFYSGICRDMAFLRRGCERRVYLATSGKLIGYSV